MIPDDFFLGADPATGFASSRSRLDRVMVDSLRRGRLVDHDDVDVAIALTQLVHDDLTSCGTGGSGRLDDADMALDLRALRAVLTRLGIDFQPQFRDYESFRSFWLRNGASNSYQARRDLLASLFDPIHARLMAAEERALASNLADPISPHAVTGWPKVDEEIQELRRRFADARTVQDHRAVGTHCVGVLMALSRTVYDPARHLREGETVPPVDKTKARLGRVIEDALSGGDNEAVRALATKAIELAHKVKHREAPSRRDAGITGDAVILVANILRRIQEAG